MPFSLDILKSTPSLDQLFDFRRNQTLKKMRYTDFQVERVLQKSEKNEVILVRNKKHTTLGRMIVKKLNNRTNKKHFIQNEINAGKVFKNSGIAKMVHYWTEGENTFLLFEFVEGKDLYDYLAATNFEPVEEHNARDLFKQIVKAVKAVHKKGFVHGDLKLENIMVTRTGKAKLIDFGFCTQTSCKDVITSYHGSLEYLAPEVLLRQPYIGCKAECWSLGVILFTLLFGEFPFSEHDRETDFHGVVLTFPSSNPTASTAAKDLIRRMLAMNPQDRPDVDSLLKDAWFQ